MTTLLFILITFATFASTKAFGGGGGSAEDGLRQLFDNFDSNNSGSLAQGDMERLAQTLSNPQNWRSMQNMQNWGAIASWWRGQILTSPPSGEAICDCIVAR